jgi:hypothetical protein
MSIAEDTKSVVGAYYPAGVRRELPAFSPHLAVQFSVTAPDYLPWGGTHTRERVLRRCPAPPA